MVGGHHLEQIHEFLEQVHHAHVAVFWQHHAFARCCNRALCVEDLDHHLNSRATLVRPTPLVRVDQRIEQGFVSFLGSLLQNGRDFSLLDVRTNNRLQGRVQTFKKSRLKSVGEFRTGVQHFLDTPLWETLTADEEREAVKGWGDEALPVAFVLISLQAQRMTTSLHSMAGVNGPRYDESAQVPLKTLFFYPRPNVLLVEFSHRLRCIQSLHGLLQAFQDNIRAHAPHLATQQFVVAHDQGSLFEVLWLVICDEHPGWFFPGKQPCDGQTRYIVLLPVKGAHGQQVRGSVSECLKRRFHVRHLLQQQVSVFPMRLHRTLNVEANTVVSRRCGENHETLTGFHRFTSARVAPCMPRAWTTG